MICQSPLLNPETSIFLIEAAIPERKSQVLAATGCERSLNEVDFFAVHFKRSISKSGS